MRVMEIFVCFILIGFVITENSKARNVEQRQDFYDTNTIQGKFSRTEEKSTILPSNFKTMDVFDEATADGIVENREDLWPVQEDEEDVDVSSVSDVFEMGSFRDQFARRRNRGDTPVTAHAALTFSSASCYPRGYSCAYYSIRTRYFRGTSGCYARRACSYEGFSSSSSCYSSCF